jgi:hypothetical protein
MGGKIIVLLAVGLLAVALLSGCGAHRGADVAKPASAGAPKDGAPDDAKATEADEPESAKATSGGNTDKSSAEAESSDAPKPVVLTADERQKLGITTASAQAITFNDSATAFGVVLSHETIAQAVADLETAASAAHLSDVAVTRGQKLASGPGALGVDTLETLQKQKSGDQAALSLARRKITAVVGVRFPWQGGAEADSGVLDALASGEAKLVRATFPSGVFVGAAPKSLRLLPLEPGADSATRAMASNPDSKSTTHPGEANAATPPLLATPVWDAPQDPNLPGRSFFALSRDPDLAEGSRFQVLSASAGNGETGVLVPATAVVIAGGQYWCYLEKKTGTFARVPIVVDKPLGAGYFVSDGVGVADGDQVVTAAAGLLLAREMNAASGPED